MEVIRVRLRSFVFGGSLLSFFLAVIAIVNCGKDTPVSPQIAAVTGTCAPGTSCNAAVPTGLAVLPTPTRIPAGGGSPGGGSSTPSGTATAAPTATAATCGRGTFDLDFAPVLPFTSTGGGNGPTVLVNDPSLDNCKVGSVTVTLAATSPNLSDFDTALGLFQLGSVIDFDLIVFGTTPRTGTTLGSSCGSLVFADSGGDFSAATPPYDGTFKPAGSRTSPSSFNEFKGLFVQGNWSLPFYENNVPVGSLTITCARVHFTLTN